MLEPLALQEFSVPGAILPFYSRGSQTPTDSTKIPTAGQVEEGMEGGKRTESRVIYPSCLQESVLPRPHRHPSVLPQRGKVSWRQRNIQELG